MNAEINSDAYPTVLCYSSRGTGITKSCQHELQPLQFSHYYTYMCLELCREVIRGTQSSVKGRQSYKVLSRRRRALGVPLKRKERSTEKSLPSPQSTKFSELQSLI